MFAGFGKNAPNIFVSLAKDHAFPGVWPELAEGPARAQTCMREARWRMLVNVYDVYYRGVHHRPGVLVRSHQSRAVATQGPA